MFLLNNTELFLLGISLIGFIILSLYYLIAYARPLRASKRTDDTLEEGNKLPVSIIIYAKNDSENLKKHLPALLTQDYPEYQVVVINDGSRDDTDDTLKFFQNEYKHLYHTYVPSDARYLSRRKLAFTLGVKAAKYDILLFTEANCQPLSDQWLSAMVGGYTPETSIVLGYCKYSNYKGFFHKLIAYDNLLTGLRYLSSALSHHPYTGNGRNLSYRKELFFKHKGYYQSLNLHAGDDDLFINEASTKENTKVIYTPDSLTEMDQIERFGIWKEMKVSRAATQRYYKGSALTFYDRITGQLANLLDRRIIIFDTFYNQGNRFRQIGSNASTKPYYRLVIPVGVYSTPVQWIYPYLPAFQKQKGLHVLPKLTDINLVSRATSTY